MPLGIERINVRRRSPNDLINFITPLEDADKAIAQDYLERIAAIVYPIMKDNGLAVMNLDEFPANDEFWGRNFNAGACIQLVLKHPKTGQWLPFKFVQGVMIHELAHNKQMNHSSSFWAVRNKFARLLDALHARDYTGEGFWSAGRELVSEQYTHDRPLAESEMPQHICGGTYRDRTKHRVRAPRERLSYAETKRRRIERKFGMAGEGKSLVADVDTADRKPKPRVAQSKRGRELRAAAALARFEKVEDKKEETKEADRDEEGVTNSESEDEKAVNVGGGKFMVAVSGEQDGKEEMDEMDRELIGLLGGGACGSGSKQPAKPRATSAGQPTARSKAVVNHHTPIIDLSSDTEEARQTQSSSPSPSISNIRQPPADPLRAKRSKHTPAQPGTNIFPTASSAATPPPPVTSRPTVSADSPQTCPVCSCTNRAGAATCLACMNVLLDRDDLATWKCCNVSCPPRYRNSKDVVFCGTCGERRRSDGNTSYGYLCM